jgi:hypothetical protein
VSVDLLPILTHNIMMTPIGPIKTGVTTVLQIEDTGASLS